MNLVSVKYCYNENVLFLVVDFDFVCMRRFASKSTVYAHIFSHLHTFVMYLPNERKTECKEDRNSIYYYTSNRTVWYRTETSEGAATHKDFYRAKNVILYCVRNAVLCHTINNNQIEQMMVMTTMAKSAQQ